jgi:hypothetical protein
MPAKLWSQQAGFGGRVTASWLVFLAVSAVIASQSACGVPGEALVAAAKPVLVIAMRPVSRGSSCRSGQPVLVTAELCRPVKLLLQWLDNERSRSLAE